jgi:RimJ/RimL family protein N-acetyltransferase
MRSRHPAESRVRPAAVRPEGERLAVRPLEARDRDAFAGLFARLSPDSRYRRFHGPKPALGPRELAFMTNVDHVKHEALAAIDTRDGSIVGVSRYVARADAPRVADVAIEVADDLQGIGIGTLLAQLIVDRASINGFHRLVATTLWDNQPARALMRRLGFRAHTSDGNVVELHLALAGT